MAQKITKEELKTPDAFITFSDKAAKYIEKHKSLVFGLLGAVLVIILGLSLKDLLNSHSEAEAQKALYSLEQLVEKYNEDNKEVTGTTAEDFQKKYPGLMVAFEQLVSDHPATSGAYLGAVSIAQLLNDYAMGMKAIEVLESARKSAGNDTVFYGLISMQLSKIYLESDKTDLAVETLDSIAASSELSFLHASALLRKGVAFEKLGKRTDAESTYNKIINEFSKSQSASIAKTYLRLLSTQGE